MKIPVISGLIDRRILVNYRVAPEDLTKLQANPFRPVIYNGVGLAGVCLIRLKNLRPRRMPLPWGLRSENAAHRIAVEWNDDGETRQGVHVPRRDTSSRLSTLRTKSYYHQVPQRLTVLPMRGIDHEWHGRQTLCACDSDGCAS